MRLFNTVGKADTTAISYLIIIDEKLSRKTSRMRETQNLSSGKYGKVKIN